MFMARNTEFLEEIANDSVYWIGDTGSSTHITMSDEGVTNLQAPQGESAVVMVNGEKVTKNRIGTV